jgi:hypothetical protein
VTKCGPAFETLDPIPKPFAMPEKNPGIEDSNEEGPSLTIITKVITMPAASTEVAVLEPMSKDGGSESISHTIQMTFLLS